MKGMAKCSLIPRLFVQESLGMRLGEVMEVSSFILVKG